MDSKQFRQLIEQVAVIKDRKPTTNGSHRPAMETVIELDEDGEEVEVERRVQDNPTLGFEFVKLKPNKKPCELGCGKHVDNQIVERRLAQHPKPHWRTKCQTCGYFVHPTGLGFVETGQQIQAEYVKWFNKGCPTELESNVLVRPENMNKPKVKTKTKNGTWVLNPDGSITLVEDNQNS